MNAWPKKLNHVHVILEPSVQMSVLLTASQYNDYLAIRVQPPSLPITTPGTASTALPSKHVCFFFDTSGSMSEEGRMSALQATMKLLIKKKPDSYKFTFISYASSAKIEALAETDPSKLETAVNALVPNGGTNIEAALLAIRDVVAHGVPIDSFILFTDGHVNEGAIHKSSGFITLLQEFIPILPPIHTIGCGPNYNQTFLKNVADETRSIHFYADVVETLPAVVADILEGMRTEIGTQAQLVVPDGWINAECGKQTNRTVMLGHLIADHSQWIVLKSVIETTTLPTLVLSYIPSNTRDTVSVSCDVTDELKPIEMASQVARIRIATVYSEVSELLERGGTDVALKKLNDLTKELKESIANKTDFLLTALAQIEEMKESIPIQDLTFQPPPGFNAPTGPPPLIRSASSRTPSGPPVLSRLASNTVALTNQRGFFSRMSSGPPEETYTFSSPAQRQAQQDLTQSFANATDLPTCD